MKLNKLYSFLDDLKANLVQQGEAIAFVASASGLPPALVKKQVKATGAAKAAKRESEVPAFDVGTDGLYWAGSGYWRLESNGNYFPLTREDALLELRQRGYSSKATPGQEVPPNQQALHHLQTNCRVEYAAPLCGRPAGLYVENGMSVLATSSPTIVEAAQGDAAPLVNLFQTLFGRDAGDSRWQEQYKTFLAWVQRFRTALHNPTQHLPGQALFLVGPTDCGKTLTQGLLTQIFGGRQADPSLWITGKSAFNDGIWGAEHWAASDNNIEDTTTARKTLRDRIKEATANQYLGCHRKYCPEITLRPIARMTFSANDDASSTFVLPPLDESTQDKVIYLKCYRPPVPFPTNTEAQAAEFMQRLHGAIPAFLRLVEGFEVPVEMQKGRFGVREFHHPDIVSLLVDVNADSDLADLLTDFMEPKSVAGVAGSLTTSTGVEQMIGPAVDLYQKLLGSDAGETFKRVCPTVLRFSQGLGRLRNAPGWRGRIESRKGRKENTAPQTIWTIRRKAGAGEG